MKYLLILLAPLLIAANADLQIDMVYYDPVNARGSEAVLIKNTGPDRMDITGYKLATRTSPQDHTLQGFIEPYGTYLSAYTGWSTLKDNQSWPNAQHEQAITLANAGGYVHLTTPDGEILDTVGWKSTEVFLGTPHPGVAKGMALVRVSDTQNNSADFAELLPFSIPETAQEEDAIKLEFFVENTPPHILSIEIEDDFPDREGVQLLPLPQGRQVQVNVTVQDNNTLHATTVYVNGMPLSANTSKVQDTFTGTVLVDAFTETLNITVRDENHTSTQLIDIEVLAAASLALPDSIQATLRPGETSNTTLIVENTGGAPLDLHIRGNPPASTAQLLGKVFYEIQGEEFELSRNTNEHYISLAPGQQLALVVRTKATFVPAGSYSGQLVIAGVLS
jgi:hypothetical protein